MKTQTKAIVAAIVVLALALGTVSGVTYSWFTDSESSGPITVTSGNLDLEVEYTIDGENWDDIDDAKNLFTGPWEPGHTEVVALKVKNEGSLALKYTAYMNIIDLVKGTNLDNEEIDLSKHLTVSTIVQEAFDAEGNENPFGSAALFLAFDRENGITYEKTSIMADDKCLISEVQNKTERELHPGASHYLIVKVDMPETVGNEINYATPDPNNPDDSTNIPSMVLGIDLIAAQFNSESDSFGTGYDKDAEYEALLRDGNNYSLSKDVTFTDKSLLHTHKITEPCTFYGNGNTFTGVVTSADKFQWEGGTIPAMSTIFSSENGSKVTVNDLTFTGTMSAVMAGHYQNATYSNYNTEFNNVNIINAEVVSFSANISPALCVYGTMVMNECTVKDTTLSPLDTDPQWPVYDMALVNYSKTTLNNCDVGSIIVWAKAKLTINEDTVVDRIVAIGNMNVSSDYGITIKAGATVGTIDLTAITNKAKVNITIEEGATVGSIVSNGVSYSSIDSWKNGVVVKDANELEDALENLENGDIIVLGGDIAGDMTVAQASGVGITIDGAGKTFAGVLTVDGKSATFTTAGLTIKNVNFKADSISADACIRLGDGTNATRYTCNVTVEGCTFDVPGAVGIKSYTGGDKNLTIKNCTATSKAHSLVQAKGIDGILVDNCTVKSKNGLNFNNSDNVKVQNCTVDVKGYAVRFGESSGGVGAAETYLIKNCTLKSANDDGDAVIILRGTADNSTLTIENTTITGTPDITNTATNATVIK